MKQPTPRLTFTEVARTGKTHVWHVRSGNMLLASIKWYPHWRRYVFCPGGETLFDASRLGEVIEFIDAQMAARKAA